MLAREITRSGAMKMGSTDTGSFARDKYVVLRDLVSGPARAFLYQYAVKAARDGRLAKGDSLVPKAPCRGADPFMEWLLGRLCPRIEVESGMRLFPTYSYFRVYGDGDELQRHQDRPSCEISLTLSLGYKAAEAWPIWAEVNGIARSVALEPGEAMLYRGIELPHWRDKFTGDHAAQVFLHYVDQNGPYKEWKFDKRPRLDTMKAVDHAMEEFAPYVGGGCANVRSSQDVNQVTTV
jgi:hypothetical protein